MTHPLRGLSYLPSGFGLIFKPGMKRYLILPLSINLLIFIGLFLLFNHFMAEFNHWFSNLLPTWLLWLGTFIWLCFFLSFFLIFLYAYVILANIAAAPFNSLLAEKAALYLKGILPEERSILENIKDIPRAMARQGSILGYYLPRALLILILFLIPIVQVVAPFIWFIFNAWYMTMTYIDYPTDNQRIPLTEVRTWLNQRRGTALLFGVTILFASMVPLLNVLVMPAAVAGAVKFWVEEQSIVPEERK